MNHCIGKYKYNGQLVDCPVKWRCNGYDIKGGDSRKISKPVLVELKNHIFVPSCFDDMLPNVMDRTNEA